MKADYQRQMNFYSPSARHNVLIVGAGSTGSYLAFGLARMGVKDITVVDFDTVENHNLPNQFFSESQLSEKENELFKVFALEASLRQFMPDTMKSIKYTSIAKNIKECYDEVFPSGKAYSAIFMAVDDMNIRKWLWTEFTSKGQRTKYYIDPRTGGEYANIFSIDTQNTLSRTVYEQNLWSNEEVEPLSCTGRAVIDVTLCVVGECIGRFRQAMKANLQVIWTFHSYNIGSSVIMAHSEIKDKVIRDDAFVANIGTEVRPEERIDEVADGQAIW